MKCALITPIDKHQKQTTCKEIIQSMNRKRSVDLYSLLGVQSVAGVVRHGRLKWFGHVERKSGDVEMWWWHG